MTGLGARGGLGAAEPGPSPWAGRGAAGQVPGSVSILCLWHCPCLCRSFCLSCVVSTRSLPPAPPAPRPDGRDLGVLRVDGKTGSRHSLCELSQWGTWAWAPSLWGVGARAPRAGPGSTPQREPVQRRGAAPGDPTAKTSRLPWAPRRGMASRPWPHRARTV